MGDAPIFYTQHIHYHAYFCGSGGVFDNQGAPLFRLTQGSLPITWVITGVPPGMSAPSSPTITALLTGTPSASGSYTIHATATNAFGSDAIDLFLDVGEQFLAGTGTSLSVFGTLYEIECTSSIIVQDRFLTAIGDEVNFTYQALSGLSQWQNLNIIPYAGPCGGFTFTPPPPHAPVIKAYAADNSGTPQPPSAAPTSFTPGHCYTEDLKAFDFGGSHINYSITTCFVDPWHYTPPPAVTMGPRSYYQ